MANNYFNFKEFTIFQERSAFKVGTDGVLLGAAAELNNVKRILDIGTGTGLISIMLAQRCKAEIVAIEPDTASFEEARENVKVCPWSKRIEVLNTDLRTYSSSQAKFDLIVSNPPYFSDSLINPDPRKSAARHDISLSSDELLEGVQRLMEKNGRFQLIMPYVEGNIFIASANKCDLYCNSILKIRSLPDSATKRLILSFSYNRIVTSEKFLTIENGERHKFTQDYINLTKDFYLKF